MCIYSADYVTNYNMINYTRGTWCNQILPFFYASLDKCIWMSCGWINKNEGNLRHLIVLKKHRVLPFFECIYWKYKHQHNFLSYWVFEGKRNYNGKIKSVILKLNVKCFVYWIIAESHRTHNNVDIIMLKARKSLYNEIVIIVFF